MLDRKYLDHDLNRGSCWSEIQGGGAGDSEILLLRVPSWSFMG